MVKEYCRVHKIMVFFLLLCCTNIAVALDKITVAYFLEWPTPNQIPQIDKTFDNELGVEVEWRAFANGNDMVQAMVSGDVQIAFSMGFVPFIVGVSNGAPIKMVGVAVTYAEADLCVVRDTANITKENAKELEGKKVATPVGNVTHYKLIRTMDHLGVDMNKISLIQMNPADAAIALIRGDVTMGCGYGGGLLRMKTVGQPLMTGAEQEAVGINTFDIVSVNNRFAENHPDLVKKFLAITNTANQHYKQSPEEFYPKLSKASGLDLDATKNLIATSGFPSNKEQMGKLWLGGGVQDAAKGVADVMVSAGGLDKALDSYSAYIDSSYLE